MKFNVLASTLSIASLASAFSDTAIFYSNNQLPSLSNTNHHRQYITESKSIASSLLEYSESICSEGKQLYIYRVKQLSKGHEHDGLMLGHVHYPTTNDLNFEMGSSCVVKYGEDSRINANVVIIDVEDDQQHTIDEFVAKGHENLLVQGNPSFKHNQRNHKQFVNDVVEKLFENDEVNLVKIVKRDEDVDEDEIEREIEQDFKEAESLAAGRDNDNDADEDDIPITKPIKISKNNTRHDVDNLFTNYQFFTSGIWLGIIVSLLLLSILYGGISWLASLEVSYPSFEKQVDYDKKNE